MDAGSSLTEITDCTSPFAILGSTSTDCICVPCNTLILIVVVEEATPNFRIREVKPSAGVPTGSDLVSTEAFEIIQDQLSGSRYGVSSLSFCCSPGG